MTYSNIGNAVRVTAWRRPGGRRPAPIKRGTGARDLRGIVEPALLDTMYELPGIADVREVVFTADDILYGTNPRVVYVEAADVA